MPRERQPTRRTRRTAGNHLNGIRSNDDQPKIKHHYRDRSRVCLFVCGSRCCASSLAMGACQMLFRGGAYGNKVCVNVKNLTTIAEDRRTTDGWTDNGRTTDGQRTDGQLTITGNVNLLCVQSKFASENEHESESYNGLWAHYS